MADNMDVSRAEHFVRNSATSASDLELLLTNLTDDLIEAGQKDVRWKLDLSEVVGLSQCCSCHPMR